MAIGLAATILILLWVNLQIGFDRFHEKIDRLYEVYNLDRNNESLNTWNTTPKVMAGAIQKDFPEVEKTARFNWGFPVLFTHGEMKVKATGNMVDSTFLEMFSFPLLKGRPEQVLMDANSIVITESFAKKLFGNEDPIGKTVVVDRTENLTVSGLLKDLPKNSRFKFEFLVSWAFLRQKGWDDDNWGNNSTTTYVLLKENTKLSSLAPKLKILRKHYDKSDPNLETFLHPFSRSYLYNKFENGVEAGGRIEMIRLFSIIAGFILLIACINFMNLNTARSERRAKEVGIRKTVGAGRLSLIAQFLGESVLVALLAFMLALVIVYLALPLFNEMINAELSFDLLNKNYWLVGIAIVLITGMVAGIYPAFYLSAFNPIGTLKNTFRKPDATFSLRKVLVVFQFTIAICLIISTIIVRQQIHNAQQRNTGYDKEELIYVFLEGELEKNYDLLKQELLERGLAVSVTKTNSPITEVYSNTWGIKWQGKDPADRTIVERWMADDAVVKTCGLTLLQGRDFDLKQFPTDSQAVILNETAVKLMGFKEPIGQLIDDDDRKWHVIGVVKDFIMRSPFHQVTPTVIEGALGWFNAIHIKLSNKYNGQQRIAELEKIFKKFNPEYPLVYTFVDESYAQKFFDERRTGKLATTAAILAIVISCLGLFGLATYMAEVKTKEIGIRKVLGASVHGITFFLSQGFLKLVLVSFVIAAPLVWYSMKKWLEGYPYRINIEWWMFAWAGLGAMLIAFATISYQSIRAATANPVKSLRTE